MTRVQGDPRRSRNAGHGLPLPPTRRAESRLSQGSVTRRWRVFRPAASSRLALAQPRLGAGLPWFEMGSKLGRIPYRFASPQEIAMRIRNFAPPARVIVGATLALALVL